MLNPFFYTFPGEGGLGKNNTVPRADLQMCLSKDSALKILKIHHDDIYGGRGFSHSPSALACIHLVKNNTD